MAEKKKGFDLAAALGLMSSLDTGMEGREQIEYHHIEHLIPDERNFYELSGIDELAASIEFAGLQQPLRVRPGEVDGSYVIVSGHRRHAALKQLIGESQELYERFCQVPCIVEKPSGQTTEVEAMLQELRLIYGNSDTRKMSSADISKQAERVEMLLYQLKEAGVEFPGKMRDHVAEACKVSASKLARLKAIREGLGEEFKPLYESDQIGESMAYVLARFPKEFQSRLAKALKAKEGGVGGYALPGAVYLERILEEYESGRRWEPCMTCPDGKECKRGDVFLRHDCSESLGGTRCGGKTCCLECGAAKASYYPCENMCSKAKAQRKEKTEKADAAEKARRLKEAKKPRRETQASAQRLLPLIDAAGLKDEELLPLTGYSYLDKRVGQIRRWANGEFEGEEGFYSDELSRRRFDVDALVKTARLLGCTTDFLLRVTDEPQPVVSTSETVISFEKPQWNTGTPGVVGSYYCQVDIGGERGKSLLNGSYWWNGKSWLFKQDGADINYPVVGWWPLPDAQEETP